jgi:uncharacterized damage-inducible protein DinB
MSELGRALIEDCRKKLVEAYPAQIREALAALDDDDVWSRPNAAANSVGNLVLHLVGSSRHFIGRGLGGSDYVRDRPAEFAERGPVPRPELERQLREAAAETARVLDRLDPGALLETCEVAGEPHTPLALVSRVAHHWAVHTGQIVYVAKARREGAIDEVWRRTMG